VWVGAMSGSDDNADEHGAANGSDDDDWRS